MKKLIYLSAFVLTTLVSCTQDDGVQTGPNASIVGFAAPNVISQNFTDVPTDQVSVAFNYVSYANETIPSEDVTVTWEVDAVNSTAVEGVEFDFTSASRQFTIPGGQTVVVLPIDVYPVAFEVDTPTKLVLKLTTVDSNNAIIGAQYKSVTVVFQGLCPSNLAGSYSCVTTRTDNFTTYSWSNEIITSVGPGQYVTSTTARFYSPGGDPGVGGTTALVVPAGYNFSDVCNSLTVTSTNLANAYTNLQTQSDVEQAASFVDTDTGVITIRYSIGFTNNTVFVPYESVYTPN